MMGRRGNVAEDLLEYRVSRVGAARVHVSGGS